EIDVAEFAAPADIADVVGESLAALEELLGHFEISAEAIVPGDEPVLGVVHGDALHHVLEGGPQLRLGAFPFGDVGIDGDEPAAGNRIAVDFEHGAVRSGALEDVLLRQQRQALLHHLLEIDVAEFAAPADIADVVGESLAALEELLGHFEISTEAIVPGDEPVVGVVHGDALHHVIEDCPHLRLAPTQLLGGKAARPAGPAIGKRQEGHGDYHEDDRQGDGTGSAESEPEHGKRQCFAEQNYENCAGDGARGTNQITHWGGSPRLSALPAAPRSICSGRSTPAAKRGMASAVLSALRKDKMADGRLTLRVPNELAVIERLANAVDTFCTDHAIPPPL